MHNETAPNPPYASHRAFRHSPRHSPCPPLWRALAFIVAVFGLFAARDLAAKPPNLILFYADDLGWGDLGSQGNRDIPTPNIDSIAKNGIRFTNGYVAANYCSPSRAGLITGVIRPGSATNSIPSPM